MEDNNKKIHNLSSIPTLTVLQELINNKIDKQELNYLISSDEANILIMGTDNKLCVKEYKISDFIKLIDDIYLQVEERFSELKSAYEHEIEGIKNSLEKKLEFSDFAEGDNIRIFEDDNNIIISYKKENDVINDVDKNPDTVEVISQKDTDNRPKWKNYK